MVSPIGALLGSRQCIPQLGYSSQAWLEGVVLIYSGTGLPWYTPFPSSPDLYFLPLYQEAQSYSPLCHIHYLPCSTSLNREALVSTEPVCIGETTIGFPGINYIHNCLSLPHPWTVLHCLAKEEDRALYVTSIFFPLTNVHTQFGIGTRMARPENVHMIKLLICRRALARRKPLYF